MEFQKFKSIPRLSRDIIITEKLDGSSFQLFIYNSNEPLLPNTPVESIVTDEFIDKYSLFEKEGIYLFAGSRKRWLDTSSDGDNHGSAKWAKLNAEELLKLGEGRHYGEFIGKGIQRNYGLDEKRFYLFNVNKWNQFGLESRLISVDPKTNEEKYTEDAPKCCYVVPILYDGKFDTNEIELVLHNLKIEGSLAVPNFKNPEGIVILHKASNQLFKKTMLNDEKGKTNVRK